MENLSKALELHFLPESLWWADGVKTKSTQSIIVERRVLERTGKFKPYYEIQKKDDPSGSIYAFSQLRSLVHDAFNKTTENIDGSFTISHDRRFFTVPTGQFAGHTYWTPALDVQVSRTEKGCEVVYMGEPWQNTANGGYPEPTGGVNPKISIVREDYSSTGKLLARTYPVYTKSELMAKTGWSEEEIREARTYTWVYEKRNPETHVNNTSADIAAFPDGVLTPIYYINGVSHNSFPDYRQLKVNYMKNGQLANHPIFAERWILDNPGEETISGSYNPMGFAWRLQRGLGSGPLPNIKVVAGTKAAFDTTTNTLTYNADKPAVLWYQTEESPAQGKNWGAECYRDLSLGINMPTAKDQG